MEGIGKILFGIGIAIAVILVYKAKKNTVAATTVVVDSVTNNDVTPYIPPVETEESNTLNMFYTEQPPQKNTALTGEPVSPPMTINPSLSSVPLQVI